MRSSLRALNPRCQESLGNSRGNLWILERSRRRSRRARTLCLFTEANGKCEHLGIDRYGNMDKYWKQVSQIKSDSLRTCSLHVELELERMPWTSFPTLSLSCSIFSYFLFGEREAAFSFFTLFMPDLYLAKQQPCKVLLWQSVGWRSSVQMYRRRFLLRADFQRQQGFQFCLLVMLQPMLGALLESANPFAQSHHSSYCAPGGLMMLYEAYIVWFTSFFHFFSVHSPSHPTNSNHLSIEF